MRLSTFAALAAIAAIVVATRADARLGTTPERPATTAARPAARATPDPASFARPVANPWFPLVPGTVTRLRGTDEGVHLRERVTVTHRTEVIQGVTTRVVLDVLRRADGTLAERTSDTYAADDRGNVWYFGERTATFDEHGRLDSREGSWRAGVGGARAGLIMPADPHATDAYRQELFRGHAEDQAWIVGFKPTERTPMRRFRHVLRTFEWTRLEPGVLSLKLYARGVGIVRERDMAGGSETFAVVSVHRP
ncbi:hypothetical protein JCM18899A_08090 [Nocardioides sp. AN3]